MYKTKEKNESSLNTKRSENRFLRVFRSVKSFQASPLSLERTDQEDVYTGSHEKIRNVMLEAEYQRAKAIMAWQENQRF